MSVAVTPQPPGRTPHSASRRASGTTQPPAPQCWSARLRHDVRPGGEDQPPLCLMARLRHDHAKRPRGGPISKG